MVGMTAMLVSVAELTNIFSVLAVLICFCAMVLFIMRNIVVFRLNGDEIIFGNSIHQVSHKIPQMKMMKVHIPFTFKLNESSRLAGQDAVEIVVSSQVPYTLHAFWGVSIRDLHLFLWRPWSVLQAQSSANTLLDGSYQHFGLRLKLDPHNEQTNILSLPDPPLELGAPPRIRYPLVIFLTRSETDDIHPDETVSLVSVVHIKDKVCTLPTSVLAQYLKQANGQLSCLKQLYLATGNPMTYEDDPTSEVVHSQSADELNEKQTFLCNSEQPQPIHMPTTTTWTSSPSYENQLCVVCQYFPLSRALLPCRHTCICASCFSKLDRCPMCRGPITSYFCIRSEEYLNSSCPGETGTGNANTLPKSEPPSQAVVVAAAAAVPPQAGYLAHLEWLHDWNDRLTDFLGFAR